MALLLLFVLALGAGILGGGSSLIMLPALDAPYGPRTPARCDSIDAMRMREPRYTLQPIRFEECACRLCW